MRCPKTQEAPMRDPLYRFSVATVSFARLVEAGFYLGLFLVFVVIALWLTLSFGLNWFVIGLDIVLGLKASESFVKACTVYSTSRSPERPDERQRYLESRSLYFPRNRRETSRNPRTGI
jgi:hypothetical protein